MDDRIQRALDGDLPADQLTPAERIELRQYRATICTGLAPLQRLPSIDVAPQVMRAVAPARTHRTLQSLLGWLWAPRAFSLTLRPAFVIAGAVAAWVGFSTWLVTEAASAPAQVVVQFRLGQTEARQVALVGDFNGWRPRHQLHQIAAGVWSVDVALEPGVYNYVFVIDGKTWRLDPLAPQVTDGFGGASSRVSVLAPEVRS